MILFCLFVFLKQRPVKLKSSSQMVKSLLVVSIVKIGFAKLSVSFNKDKKVFSVDVYKDFAHCQLFNSYLYLTIKVL